jgi:hypothetical protein
MPPRQENAMTTVNEQSRTGQQEMTEAQEKLAEALKAIQFAQMEVGRSVGGRQVALAATNAEQAMLWLESALKSSFSK